jgi:general secretion pathway protein D
MRFIRYGLLIAFFVIFSYAKEITINFQNTPIEDIIKFVAKKEGINILMNERISGNVNFISNKPIEDNELLTLLEHILRVKGYALSPSATGYYELVRGAQASKEVMFGEDNKVGMDMEVFRPAFIKPSEAAGKITSLASPFAVITSDDKLNLLLVSDYPKNLRNIKKLLKLFDTHLKRNIENVPLQHYRVKTAFPKLQNIFKITADQYSGPIELIDDEYQNSIWVTANSEDMQKIIDFIQAFDKQAANSATTHTKIIFLKNANVEDIEKTVQTIANSRDKDKPIKSVVSSNKELNAIVISSTYEQINDLEKLIREIDIERRQVFVKVQIYEVRADDVEKLGAKWGFTGGYETGLLMASGTLNMGGSAFALSDEAKGIIDFGSTEKAMAIGVVLDLLKSEGSLETVSEPNLLCVNNIKSTVYVGETRSVLTSSQQGGSTTDITRNNYTREDIGLTLEITPQIADKDKVVLKVKTKVEDVKGGTDDKPLTYKREVDTTSIVQNGESIILGGLMKDYTDIQKSKVPLLGDIPFLGALFRHTQTTDIKITTIMILTPFIVNSSEELEEVQDKLEKFTMEKLKLSNKIRTILEKEGRLSPTGSAVGNNNNPNPNMLMQDNSQAR